MGTHLPLPQRHDIGEMKIIAIAIQKGGSGKTTTALNLAAALRELGKRVLLLDLDPQANLTQALGVSEEIEPNIYHALRQEAFEQAASMEALLVTRHGLDLAPASIELAAVEIELVSIYGREQILKPLLHRLKAPYDFVLIDCPPSMGMLTVNALVASDLIIMPLQAEFLPLKGVRSFMLHLEKIKKLFNPGIDLLGFVLTKYDRRKTMNRNVLEKLKEEYGEEKIFSTFIRTNIALVNAQEKGVDIFTFDKNANGAKDYLQLAQEMLAKM
ncbi:MAG TPA: ParA family protein [Saprospiraceae bacterium]|nr:ParA family protein [Saprospiraceae bacterium]